MAKIEKIEGVIVFDLDSMEYGFKSYADESWFKDGMYQSEYSKWVFVANHTIEISIPEDFDIIKPQLAALDAQETELTAKYQSALTQIQVKRNNLLAIEG